MTSANLMHEVGHPKPVLWDNSERKGEEGGGTEDYTCLHVYTCDQFMWMYGRNHHNVVK